MILIMQRMLSIGDLSDGEAIVDFLSSDKALNLPDRIEEVSAKHLEKLIGERLFMAVLFCKYSELIFNYLICSIVYMYMSTFPQTMPKMRA